jgi:hypothetical protein
MEERIKGPSIEGLWSFKVDLKNQEKGAPRRAASAEVL